jgi:hypothetical protein
MSLRKLKGRSFAELRERGEQAFASWLERAGLGDSAEYADSEFGARLQGDVLTATRPLIQGTFFACVDDRERTLLALRSADPAFETRLCDRADQVIDRRFDLLGHRGISTSDEIDWSLDPLKGVKAPPKHWSRIRFLDPDVAGDHKLVWELNRHQFLITLAQAWWCSGIERYATACDQLLRSWMDGNPPKRGVNWASSLEVSYRSIAWLWVLALLGDALSESTRKRALGFLMVSGRHLSRYLSTYFSPNTHLTGEALGLYYLGTALPQCRDARAWRDLGRRILLDCVDRHIRDDGVYVEPATWYHRYTVDIYTHFCILADRSGQPAGDRTLAALERSLEYLAFITRPDGSIPIIGDDDGGRLVPLDERTAVDARTPLAVGAALFNRTDFAYVAGPASPELVWLLGADGLDRFNRTTAAPPQRASQAFPAGGVYVMRDSWRDDASLLVVDAGPHGFMNAGHSHADALSIDLAVRGEPVFVDPGTFTYTVEPAWRDYFRSTAAHSAVTVDGFGSAQPSGPFTWSSRAEARSLLWFAGPVATLFAGTHDGFQRLEPSMRYERAIVFVTPDLWIVLDTLRSTQEREMRVHWQCAPNVIPTHEEETGLVLSTASRQLRLLAHGAGPVQMTGGWVSAVYGVREPAPHVSYAVRGSGETTIATILVDPADQPIETHRPAEAGIVLAVRWGNRRGVLARGSCSALGIETDAALAWIELDPAERPITVTAAGVTRLSMDGRSVAVAADDGVFCALRRDGWAIESLNRNSSVASSAPARV